MNISTKMIENWLGSDNTLNVAVDVIKMVANGSYDPKLLKAEIREYSNE